MENGTKKRKECEICGQTEGRIHFNKEFNGVLCRKHYEQYLKFGEFKDAAKSVYKRPNEIVKHEDFIEIIITNYRGVPVDRTIVDSDVYPSIKKYRWHRHYNVSTDSYYAVSSQRSKGIKSTLILSRVIMNCPENKMIDHINHDTMDNRKNNLRVVGNNQNQQNLKGPKKNNESGFLGVHWHSHRGMWKGQVTVNRKRCHAGYFDCAIDAAVAVEEMRSKLIERGEARG
jgi:hypothetical protein